MKFVEANYDCSFSHPFIMGDGSFACLETKCHERYPHWFNYVRVLNISSGERYKTIKLPAGYINIFYSWTGMILIHTDGAITRYYDLFTGKRLNKKNYTYCTTGILQSVTVERDIIRVPENIFVSDSKHLLFIPRNDPIPVVANSSVICSILSQLQSIAIRDRVNLVVVSRTDGSDVKFIDLGFPAIFLLLSSDGYTAAAGDSKRFAVIDLD